MISSSIGDGGALFARPLLLIVVVVVVVIVLLLMLLAVEESEGAKLVVGDESSKLGRVGGGIAAEIAGN